MIIGYCGLPGTGKTYSMAMDAIREMKRGRKVFANFPLKGAHYFTDLKQVLGVRKGIILADELNVLCPSRMWRSIPTEYMMLWTQSRKLGIDFWYSTQNFHRVDVSIRGITNYVWRFKRIIGPWHRGYLFDAVDVERERTGTVVRKKNFIIRKQNYSLYDTMTIIRPAEHLAQPGLEAPDPDELPIFGEDLNVTQEPTYVQDTRADLPNPTLDEGPAAI